MSTRRRVVVLANDVVPGMGLPVAAPGLRAWGIAEGLRELGHDVTLAVDQQAVAKAWRAPLPVPLPPGSLLVRPRDLTQYVATHGVEALVVTNSNHVPALGDLGSCRLVYDFFAPKMLELAEQAPEEGREEALAALATRKRAALARSDAVIVNGSKKLPYVRRWLAESGVPDLPVETVLMALPPVEPAATDDGPLRTFISGYLQPWSRPGPVMSTLTELLTDGTITLDLLVSSHWGPAEAVDMHPEFAALATHPGAVQHRQLRFDDFRRTIGRCHVSIDLFARNPERELAMVTRSVVALSCGVPVVHVPFTEVSPLIEEYDAGWLVDPEDSSAVESLLREAAADRSVLAKKRDGAVRLSRELFAPGQAVAPLDDLLERLS